MLGESLEKNIVKEPLKENLNKLKTMPVKLCEGTIRETPGGTCRRISQEFSEGISK